MTEKGMPDGLTYLSRVCAWGSEQCAQIAENESGWFFYLLFNWPLELALALLVLFVAWTLPAAGWLLIAEEYRRHHKPPPARRNRA